MNRLALALLPPLLAAAGCTVVLAPGEAQCQSAKDCEARGFMGAVCMAGVCQAAAPVDPVWGCLGHVVEPMPDRSKKVDFSVHLAFASDKLSVTMATIDVCEKIDLDCTGKSPNDPKGLSPDAKGFVSLSVLQGFDGFIRVSGPEVMDSRVFVGRPIITPPTVKEVRLIRPNEYTMLVAFAGQKVDPMRGTAILLGVDCQALPVSGVRFESPSADAKSEEFYLINQAPTPPPDATKTDIDGFGGFLNLPVGAAVARSYRASDSMLIGESSFHILANTISYVQIAPHPELTMKADRVGKYHIIALLGQGGMASVFLSVVPGPLGVNKLLVVKLLRDELSQDADFLAMFLNEARLATRLNHANVVQTYEIGVEGGHHYLAMDYLDGQPLHAVLRKASRGGVPLDVHVRILAEMLAGLHYAHTLVDFDGTPLHVVHRDVSPQNVFVTYDGQVKVVDFGIAKAAGASSNTQSGVFKGKLSYVAPEQAGGEPVDARSDVFSVGVMLWEAMARKRFAQGDSQTALLGRRLTGREPRIREVVPDADAELADICDRAMALAPGDRFASALEFRDALEAFLDRFSRRVGPREVGQFVTGLFAEEREKIRGIIDEQMKRLLRETGTALPMPTIDVFPGAQEPTPITSIEALTVAENAALARSEGRSIPAGPESGAGLSGSHGTLVAAHISQTPPEQSSRRVVPVVVALLALALAGGLGVALLLRPAPAPPPKATTTADGVVDAAQLKLSITFGPPGAVAKLDGVPLAESPFVAHVRRDGSMHRIDVEGAGLKSETRMVSYEKDIVVALSLQTADPAPAPSATVVVAALPGTAVAALPGDAAKRPPGASSARPKAAGPALGIDEKDPYKK